MTDHHPDAADVLAHGWADDPEDGCVGSIDDLDEWYTTPRDLAVTAIAALSAAGLAVVKVGDVPPWMEQVALGPYRGWLLCNSPDDDEPELSWESDVYDEGDPEATYDLRLYVVKREQTP